MTAGLCVCVLLVVLCTSCLGLPHSSRPLDGGRRTGPPPPSDAFPALDGHTSLGPHHLRQRRSPPQLDPLPLAADEAESRANLNELLARLISSRKGSVRRNSSVNSRSSSGLSANHRITDRDYLGWMDFGRRSAEEYEYSS